MNILDIAIAKKLAGGGGGSGTDNYNDLSNLPKINDTTLSGNKSSSALGLQSEINSDSKLASDLVDDTNQDNKFVTSTEKNTWNAKQNAIDADHKLSSDLVDDANKTNKFVTSTEKNTWNAKQNAIDSDHKLSSSLVSFSTAEAAALASGIDSTKVGQISTNQTNILYAINNGVKNICDYVNPLQLNNCEIVDGEFKQIGTDSKANLNFMVSAVLSNGTTYALFTAAPITTNGEYSYEFNFPADAVAIRIGHNGTTRDAKFDINIDHFVVGTTYVISINVLNCVQSSGVYRFNKIMICTKQLWDTIGHDFQPPALPNSDLTYLEAEDRAALAEEIDAGAKNSLQLTGTTSSTSGITVTWNYAEGYVQVNGTSTPTSPNPAVYIVLGTWIAPADGYYKISAVNAENASVYVYDNSTWATYNGSTYESVKYFTKGTQKTIYLRVLSGYQANNLKIYPMICTKAAFDVSPAYAPYRKNLDQLEATKAPALTLGSGVSSGSLDDVTKPTFDLYLDTVSNLPTIAAYYVETSVWDSQSMIQRAYNVGNAESYIRIKSMNTWSAWKQITNA